PPHLAVILIQANDFLLLTINTDHGITTGRVVRGSVMNMAELGVTVGVRSALQRLGVALQAVPGLMQEPLDQRRRHLESRSTQLSPESRSDFDVHRSGVIGSPRDSGSTRASNASTSPGASTSARLRPPPGPRERPTSGGCGSSSSSRPRCPVSGETPAAAATTRTPPAPSSRASAPSHTRRWRSLRCAFTWSYRRTNDSEIAFTAQTIAITHPENYVILLQALTLGASPSWAPAPVCLPRR